MNATGLFPSPTWVHQVGWTLVHSIWQIALITVIYALIVFALRHASANVRYLMGCAALLMMLAVPVGTFAWLRGQAQGSATSNSVAFVALENGGASTETGRNPFENYRGSQPNELAEKPTELKPGLEMRSPFAGARKVFFAGWTDRIEPFLPWLSASWLLGSLILSLRPLWGWFTVHRLQTQGRCSLSSELQDLAAQLIDRMAIRQAVEFTQSALVETPAVVGHLRPVVLLPVSAITGLTLEQLEMILAHELAHVRRHDYLVNVIQTIVESLLFYHPGVWWVSAQVRGERENCCDDVAVAVCGDRATYVRALFSLEEPNGRNVVSAVAANGGSLLNRIRRLLGSPASTEFTMKRNAAWLGGLLVVLAMSPLAGDLSYQVAVAASSSVENSSPEGVREAIAEIERLGGSYRQQKSDDGPARVVMIDLGRTAADDTALEKLVSLLDIHTLSLNHSNITDAGLRHLRNMKKLQWLELEYTNIKGPGLENLVGMEHLLTLRLSGTKVDDAILVHVMQLEGLRELWIERTNVTQAGVRALWAVRPALKVVGVDKLQPGDPTAVEVLMNDAKKTSATKATQPQHEAASRVMGAMWARDDRVQSFLFQWNELRRDRKGTLRNRPTLVLTRDGPTNREEVVHEAQSELLVAGRKMVFESNALRPIVDIKGDVTLQPQVYRSAFDGAIERTLFQYPEGDKQSQGFQRLAGISGGTDLAATAPLLWTFCTFDEAMVNVDWNRLEVLDEPVEIGGSRCVVLTQDFEPMRIGTQQYRSQRWYVDPERDYAIVRYEFRLHDGRVAHKTDITHEEDPQWGWLPSGWTIARLDAAGNATSTVEATVTHYEINPTLSSEAFQLSFPKNTHMNQN